MMINMKKLLLLLLLSLGLIGISYADDSQEAVEREIAEFEAQLELELARQRILLLEAFVEQLEKDNTRVDFIDLSYAKYLQLRDIVAKVKSYWRYQGAEDDWECTVYVQQDVDGNVEAVNVQNCNTGDSDKARSFKNSIERAVYKASPLPSLRYEGVFVREIQFEFRVN